MVTDDTVSLDSHVDLEAEGGQIDTLAYASALAFGSIALPLGIPFAKAAAIEAQAEMAQRLEGAENFMLVGNADRQTASSRADREKRTDDAAFAYYESFATQAEQTRKHEQEEWARRSSRIGGVEMKNADWAALARLLRNDEKLRDQILDQFIARGMTRSEAETRYERVAQAAEIAAIPPGQRTQEQRDIAAQNEADPSFKRDMQDATRLAEKKMVAVRSELNQTFGNAVTDSSASTGGSRTNPAPVKAVVIDTTGPGF